MSATHPSIHQLLESEEGTIYKVTADLRVALVYPNIYYIAMSNLGWQLIYSIINQRYDTLCERVFLPGEDIKPPLRSLESSTPLNQFDIVAFSVSFEQDYPNILKILSLGGIEPEKNKRNENSPLVIMGGVCAFMNPEPLSDFVDLFVLGEAEELINELLDEYKQGKLAGENKENILSRLAKIPGVYVPQFYQVSYHKDGTIAKVLPQPKAPAQLQIQTIPKLDNWQGTSQLFSPHTEFKDTCLVEVSRGCARGCYFCLLGALYQPYRMRSLEKIKSMVNKAHKLGKKIGLLGAAVSDYPYINDLCRFLEQNQISFGISSLRADSLSDSLLNALLASGQKSFTLAPEAGSVRLRSFINKGLTDEQILQAAERSAQLGFYNLKLYFMVGLPSESLEDIHAIIDLTLAIKDRFLKYARPRGKMGQILLSVSGFVPKPHTPFQWLPMEKEAVLKEKQKIIKKSLAKVGNVKVLSESPRHSIIQGLLSRGDRRLGRLLISVHRHNSNWKQAIKSSGINLDFYIYRLRSVNEILPWQHIQSPQIKNKLIKIYKQLL